MIIHLRNNIQKRVREYRNMKVAVSGDKMHTSMSLIWAMKLAKSFSNSADIGSKMSYCFLFRSWDAFWNFLARISMPLMFDFPRHSDILNTVIVCVIYKRKLALLLCRTLRERLGLKMGSWIVPFQVYGRRLQTLKKYPSLKYQRTSFQMFPWSRSLFSGSKTCTSHTSTCTPGKDWKFIWNHTYCCVSYHLFSNRTK